MAHKSHSRRVSSVVQYALDAEAYRMRVEERLNTTEIAERLGINHGTVVRRCQRAEKRVFDQFADEIWVEKARQARRYDRLLKKAIEEFMSDRTPIRVEAVLAVMDKRARLLGLYG
jgi:predicted DNA-binding protein (UPF0251 family)